jgi:hypothetical protein
MCEKILCVLSFLCLAGPSRLAFHRELQKVKQCPHNRNQTSAQLGHSGFLALQVKLPQGIQI